VKPYGIVLADDHHMFRQGIRKVIEESEGLQVIGEASDGLELLDLSFCSSAPAPSNTTGLALIRSLKFGIL
jgi:DNA-binding NarL/FixJ family response regulator